MNYPKHLAIIPDGNRRWARKNLLAPWRGHGKGADRFDEISRAAFTEGVGHITFWAASESNLTKRSKAEIKFLLNLLKEKLEDKSFTDYLMNNSVSFKIIGRWKEILGRATDDIALLASSLEAQTKRFNKQYLTILFGYDGRQEMIEAINKLKNQSAKFKVDYDSIKNALWTHDLPPVDLVIRTGGEPHWSAGFMMWHTADSQFYFTDKSWPDFTRHELKKAFDDYAGRMRRFGK